MIPGASVLAAPCGTGKFEAWLDGFKNEAAPRESRNPQSRQAWRVTLDQAVLSRIIRSGSSIRVSRSSPAAWSSRLARGANLMKQYGSVLGRIEQSYGVPRGAGGDLGTRDDFGATSENFNPAFAGDAGLRLPAIGNVPDELMDALRIVERAISRRRKCAARGPAKSARPSSCRRPTLSSQSILTATAAAICCAARQMLLASTANYLASYGWQRGKDWESGSANFAVIQQWNKSEVYAKTIAYFASQLARAP